MKRKGFTLIELLVVIVIIAILAAILFPVFARAQEKGKQTQCLNNLKQIMLAVLQYADDYDDSIVLHQIEMTTVNDNGTPLDPADDFNDPPPDPLPPGTHRFGWNLAYNRWGATYYDLLNPYTKGMGLWLCPSGYNTCHFREPHSYGVAWGWANAYGVPTKMYSVYRPHSMRMFADQGLQCLLLWEYYFVTGTGGGVGGISAVAPRHNDGFNVNYLDGHARWVEGTVVTYKDPGDLTNSWLWWGPANDPAECFNTPDPKTTLPPY